MIGKQKGIKEGSSYAQYQQKRRDAALKRQEAARQQKVSAVRSLAQAALQQVRGWVFEPVAICSILEKL
jgi:hypothetical protein